MVVTRWSSSASSRLRRIIAAATAGALVAGGLTGTISAPAARAATVVDVIAWAPYWGSTASLSSFNTNNAQMSELTPFFFAVSDPNVITLDPNAVKAGVTSNTVQAYRSAALQKGKPLIATITDGLDARVMAAVLTDPTSRTAHVNAIVDFAVNGFDVGFDGVDLDYETFAFDDGRGTWAGTFTAWGAFVQELATALHNAGKTLALTVPPIYNNNKDNTSGYWVYNFPVMGQYADLVRIMTYSYSVQSVGPIGPYNWTSSSMDAAVNAGVPKSKLMLGIAAYGNDWITKVDGSCPAGTKLDNVSISIANALQYAANRGVSLGSGTWNATFHEHSYSYVESLTGSDVAGATVRCNVYRTVYQPDSRSVYDRVLLAQAKDLKGVDIWALHFTDTNTWAAITAARSGASWSPPAGLAPTPKSTIVTAPYPTPIFSAGPLPARFLDTRPDYKTADGLAQGDGLRAAGSTTTLQLGGRGAVPGDAKAVTLNVTVLGEGDGYVTVYPCDAPRPLTSNLNVRDNQTISNSVITKLSASGQVCIYNQSPAHLVVDVFNVLPATAFTPLASPARLADTRPGEPTIDGQSAGAGALAQGSTLQVQVTGRGGVDQSAKSAVLNVTAVGAVAPGYLTVWSCDDPMPDTSNVNFTPGGIVPNAVVTELSSTGAICVYASNGVHVVVDVFGGLAPASFSPLPEPVRMLETRTGLSTVDGAFNAVGKMAAGQTLEVPIAGRGGVAANAETVILNVTVDAPELAGFITVYACGTARPVVSNVNFAPLQTLPNLVVSKLSATGSICIYANVKTHVIVDAFGTLDL